MTVLPSKAPAKMPELDTLLSAAFDQNYTAFQKKLDEGLAEARRIRNAVVPEAPLVLAEGITYCGNNHIAWEEKSDRYWTFLEYAVERYGAAGVWGCVLRTCCVREDPGWDLRKNDLLRLNSILRIVKPHPMRRMIKDLADMHTSIRAMSSMSGNWVPLHPSSSVA